MTNIIAGKPATTSMTIEGGLLSADLPEHIAELPGQRPSDFGLNPGRTLTDSVAGVFMTARAHWQLFQERLADARDDESATTITRQQWVIPLLGLLDYQLVFQRAAAVVDGRNYAISHRAGEGENAPPVHIVAADQPLDERPGSGRGSLAPHALLQDFLNRTELLWGVVTNGYSLRLLRDSSHFSRPSYVEFDLRQIFEADQLDAFLLLYRLTHRSRLPVEGGGPDCLLEQYHQQAIEQGDRIREGLRAAVEEAIVLLGNGLLRHKDNEALAQRLRAGQLSTHSFYQLLLYLIYRFLFLMVAEERDLLTSGAAGAHYRRHYSIARLRRLADEPLTAPERFDDLWLGVQTLFFALRDDAHATTLGLPPLNGPLFEECELDRAALNNRDLLRAVRAFSSFTPPGEQRRRRINYSALDVEELGSVYESLLAYQPSIGPDPLHGLRFRLVPSEARRSSGSHYTDRSLVGELITATLVPVIEQRLRDAGAGPARRRMAGPLTDPAVRQRAEAALLSIRVLDPACGSGHFLLAAARRIGAELARVRAGGDEPSAEAVRAAIREAIAQCVYGVDRNDLTVDLCKVALWIESQNQNKPLGFLDHHIRQGDSLVGVLRNALLADGIPDAAYDPAPDDDKPTARALKKRNRQERTGQQTMPLLALSAAPLTADAALLGLPDDTSEHVRRKRAAFERMRGQGTLWWDRQLACHLYTAAFFAPLIPGSLVPSSAALGDTATLRGDLAGAAVGQAIEHAFFHWEQEFPEVFEQGGFDVVLGNPPFLGGLKISTHYGGKYRNYLDYTYDPFKGTADLCAAFFRRAFSLLRDDGTAGMIATNTIGQGDTREAGLAEIVQSGGMLYYARRFVKWKGDANVEVNLVSWKKGSWTGIKILDRESVEQISSRLYGDVEQKSSPLYQNRNKSFIGDFVRGIGFIIEKSEAERLININNKNKDCIFPYLNGQDINTHPDQRPSRYVICFHDWPLAKAKEYPDSLQIVIERAKPERDKVKEKHERENWWLFARYRGEMRTATKDFQKVLVRSEVSSHHILSFVPKKWIYSHMLVVFAFDDDYHFSLLQSGIHELWVRRNASTMRTDIRYTPSDCFDTFPFPQDPPPWLREEAARLGGEYHEHRRLLMLARQEGLTKTYNRFHNQVEAGEDIARLRALHAALDRAVLACYGWEDLEAGHGFHQNERGQTRFTVSDVARREILARLLMLNQEVAARERGEFGGAH